jgi:hypothetical protein
VPGPDDAVGILHALEAAAWRAETDPGRGRPATVLVVVDTGDGQAESDQHQCAFEQVTGAEMGEPGERDVGAVGDDDVHVTIQIDDDVDPAHQDAIRASVATLVNRSAQASRRARLLDQAHADLSAAHARPLIDAQPQVNEAVTAAAAAAKRVLEEDGSASFSTDPEWLPLPTRSLAIESPGVADQIFALPFPAQWEWHDGPRPPERCSRTKRQDAYNCGGCSPMPASGPKLTPASV